MAFFSIKLLTPSINETNQNKELTYIETPISDFNSGDKKNSNNYAFTYNEKYEEHLNSQKKLTFSLNKNFFSNNE